VKIAYVATYDPRDARQWSGLGFAMLRALVASDANVQIVMPPGVVRAADFLALGAAAGYRLVGRRFQRARDLRVRRAFARHAGAVVRRSGADIVFSPGTLPLADLECDVPIAFWTDATFAGLVDFYPEFSRLSRSTLRSGHDLEQRALSRVDLAIYSSEWAARTAIETYGLDEQKVRVLHFGSNLPGLEHVDDAERVVAERAGSRCTLLFAGRDWRRKGGDRAVEITLGLRACGIPAELLVVGPPRRDVPRSEFVTYRRPVDTRSAAAAEEFAATFRRAHFLLMPTRADCTPVVISEAAAAALPAVVPAVGGIRSIVRHGVTGALLRADAPACEYVDAIAAMWLDQSLYRRIALGAYSQYRERLDWRVVGASLRAMLSELVDRAPTAR
jgi:glycosyltransferase involved in cell wall biosynthesis